MPAFRFVAVLTLLSSGILVGQSLSNSSLNGRFYARHLMLATNAAGAVSEIRTFYGTMTFNGSGAYSFVGSQIVAAGAPVAASGSGTYSVRPTGYVTISNPQRTGAEIYAGLGQGAVVGSSTETGGGVYDLFVAIPAPTGTVSNQSLSGAYQGQTLEFPGGSAVNLRNTSFRLNAGSNGSFGDVSVTGKAANLGNRTSAQTVAAATYSLGGDGSGTANFPLGTGLTATTQLLSGSRAIYLSADGNILLGGSTTAAGHDLFIAIRGFNGTATAANLRNLYFSAGLRYEANKAGAYAGSANANGSGRLVVSRRVRQPEGVLDFTGVNAYSLAGDGTGTLELNRLRLGAGGELYAGSGLSTVDNNNYELFLGIRAAAASGTGVFINPQGVLNAGSFAPVGAPLSPGSFFTIFGTGLAPATTVAQSLPFPVTLGGVQVLVNGTAAPLYFVSTGQISALVPFATTGATATLQVVNGTVRSNAVELPLARTSPGIFTIPPAGVGPAALLRADFTLISPTSGARRGETVQLFLTGLGAVNPAGRDGAAASASPLSLVTADVKVYVGGRLATVIYKGLAPGLAGLYQLNFTIPANAPTGASVPLAIETPEAFHDMADIAISN
jgi:uncharacterized protein (TIGR03437 family)